MSAKFPPQQLRFCEEFLVDLNATKAAERAGYSKKTAPQIGYAILRRPLVQSKIKELMDARSARVTKEADETLVEISKLAHSDLRKLFCDEKNTLLPVSAWPDDAAVCVASVEVDEIFEMNHGERIWTGYTKKIKFWDKPKALDMEARHKGLYKPTEHDLGAKTLEALLDGSWEKKEEKK